MDANTSAIVSSLIENVAIPEILAVIRAHHNATQEFPTDAQVLSALALDTSRGIAIGEAWLAAHPAEAK